MNQRWNRVLGAWVAALLVVTGCASVPPYDPKPAEEGRAGVLWTKTRYFKGGWSIERTTHATVLRIDGIENQNWGPRNLTPGRHAIEVRYDRDSYLCGYFGCVNFEQSRRSFELVVEPGHSYMPFALRRCDKDWIGIFDTGKSAGDDIATWRSSGDWAFGNLARPGPSRAVVAGDDPPEHCGTP